MKQKLPFNSPALQQIDSEAEDIISSRLTHLDQLRDDIRALEERLKSASIPFTLVYVLSSEESSYEGVAGLDYEGITPLTVVTEYKDSCIVWGKGEHDEYRLSHQIFITKDETDHYYDQKGIKVNEKLCNAGNPVLSFSKPLLETKSQFRLQIENELPHFYSRIVTALKVLPNEDFLVFYSPNKTSPNFSMIELRGSKK